MPQHTTQSRSWGTRFDTLLSSHSTQLLVEDVNTISQDNALIANEASDDSKKSEKVAHDASIFIGSLPPNIEHMELNRMLSDHLSDHPEVQTIKVIRDSKGGTCAFIQCQDPDTAAILIANLHSSTPKQFMGRFLRYEPARAFRTLVVSYRAPRQFIPSSDSQTGFGDFLGGNLVELPLPRAMKISRVPGARYLSVTYNSDALAAAEKEGILPLDDREADGSRGYFNPVLYNAETLRKISTVFGDVEHFVPFESGNREYPSPHDAPRSVQMDTGCWEIKWRHRDDSISALMTLRRVPHLTVTWAHHLAQPRRSMPYQPADAKPRWQAQATSITHVAPSHFPTPKQISSADPDALVLRHPGAEHISSSVSLDGNSPYSSPSSTPCDMTWSPPNVLLDTKCMSSKRPRALSLSHKPSSGIDLSEKLFTLISKTLLNQETRRFWSDRIEADENPSLTPLPSMIGLSEVSSSSAHCNMQVNGEESNDIEVDAPLTPELGTSPITPKTPGSVIPHTPSTTSYFGDFQSRSLPDFASGARWYAKHEGPLDPTTIFVGGLEMYGPNAWDEKRVRNVFSKYGNVENVKVVRPVNKRSAFAFVKFDNKESSAKAISHEHNRLIDGRPIRVQPRDWNPQHRGSWRPDRNRELKCEANIVSHESEPSLVSRDDFRVDPSLQRPSMIAALEDRLQQMNIVEETAAKAAAPNAEQSEEKLDSSPEPLQTFTSVAVDAPTVNLGDPVSPPVLPMIPCITEASPASLVSYAMGYYHPQGWVAGFPPYPMPYMGAYPGHPLHPPMNQSTSPANSGDTHGTPSATPTPFIPPGAMYAPFIPYPYPARTPVREQGQGQAPGATEAPLIPTGFIHGDQGILVPVYPPDALNQYMTGVQGEQAPTSADTPPPSLPVQPPNTWRPYPPPVFTPGVPLPPGIRHQNTGPFPIMGPQGWMPNHPSFGANRHRQSPINGPVGSNGAPMHPMFEQRGGAPSRRSYRRGNGNPSNFRNGGRDQPGHPARGSFAPNGVQCGGAARVTGPQQDVQIASENN